MSGKKSSIKIKPMLIQRTPPIFTHQSLFPGQEYHYIGQKELQKVLVEDYKFRLKIWGCGDRKK